MKQTLYVFVGGGLGSLARYFLSRAIHASAPGPVPVGTLAVNVLASFLLGLVVGYELHQGDHPSLRLLVVVGFCGGFSTFSTFSHEMLALLRAEQYGWGGAYAALNVGLCLGATWLGLLVFRYF